MVPFRARKVAAVAVAAAAMALLGGAFASAVTTTDPVTLCIRNGATRVAADDTCGSRETKVQVASAADAEALAARLDALETAVDSQADALADLEARVVELEPSPPPPAVAGFGTIVGTCGVVAPQLDEPAPSLVPNRVLDFGGDPYDDPADRPLLTPGGQTIIIEGNAGGSGLLSDVFAFETLARCEGASLVKTQTEIVYDEGGARTDLLVDIGGSKVGVSVVRAVAFPFGSTYTLENATTLLTASLDGINESSQNVTSDDAWVKQVLAVVAFDQQHAEAIRAAWIRLDNATRADTVVYVIVTDGSDMNLYTS